MPAVLSSPNTRPAARPAHRRGHARGVALALPAGVIALALPVAAFAQAAEDEALDLPEVVVSATRIPTPEREVASSVTVITAEDIARNQWRTVPQALASVPGLNVVQTGGPGGQTSVFIRGTNSNQVKVLVDGVDFSDPSTPNGAADFSQLVTADVSRIEVLRGPQSGLYGSDAIGGVISVTTKRGEGPPKVTAYVEGGALGTFNQAVGVSGSQDKTAYALNVAHFSASAVPVTPADVGPPIWPRNNNATDNWTYSLRLDHTFSEAFQVNLVGRFVDSLLRYTPDIYPPPTYAGLPSPLQATSYAQTLLGKAEGIWTALDGNLVSTFGASAVDIKRPTEGPVLSANGTYDGERQTYYWRSLYTFMPGQSLLVGVERQNESMTSSTLYTDMDASTGNTGAYAQLATAFFDRLYVAANVRYDSNDDFGDHTTWRIAPAYLIPETGTKLKASYGTGFKAPSLYQLYAPYYGNPGLKPEESEGYDVGFEQQLLNGNLSFGLTWFHNDITNLISYDPVTYVNVNISSATTKGVEAFVAVKLTDEFGVRADYTYTDVVGYFPPGQPFGASCAPRSLDSCYPLRRPNNKVSVSVDWQATEALDLSATLIYVSSWWDIVRFSSATVDQPGYTVVNLAANYQLNPDVLLFGRIDNLFDVEYENPNGFLGQGFGAYAGLKVTY